MTSPAIAVRSVFNPSVTVQIDPWSVNPLVDDADQAVPQVAAVARVSSGQPPTMWESGDLPPFTASGVDPAVLGQLPWRTRHAAALIPDARQLLALVERVTHDPDAELSSPGLEEYVGRFRSWLRGTWTSPYSQPPRDPAAVDAASTTLYDALFGAQESAAAAAQASQSAAMADFQAMRSRTGKYADGLGRAQR